MISVQGTLRSPASVNIVAMAETVDNTKLNESVWFSKEELLKDETLICDIIEEFEAIEETLFEDIGLRNVFPSKSNPSQDSLNSSGSSSTTKQRHWSLFGDHSTNGALLEDQQGAVPSGRDDDKFEESFCKTAHNLILNSEVLMNIYDLTAPLRDTSSTEINVMIKLKSPFTLTNNCAVECYLQGSFNDAVNNSENKNQMSFGTMEFPVMETGIDNAGPSSGVPVQSLSSEIDYSADSLTNILTDLQEHYGASQVWMIMPSKEPQQTQSELEQAAAAAAAQQEESYGEYLDELMGGSVGGMSTDGYDELLQLRQCVGDLESEISKLRSELAVSKKHNSINNSDSSSSGGGCGDPNADINYKIYCEYVNTPKGSQNGDKAFIQPQPVPTDYPSLEAYNAAVDAHLQMTLSEIRRRHDEELVLSQLIKTKTQLAHTCHELDAEKLRSKKLKTRLMELKGFLQRNEHRFR